MVAATHKETDIIPQIPAGRDADGQDKWHTDSPPSEKVVNHTTYWVLAEEVWSVPPLNSQYLIKAESTEEVRAGSAFR